MSQLITKLMAINITTADLGLIQHCITKADAGAKKPGWAEAATALERDPSNLRRAATRLEEAGLLTIDPLTVSDQARELFVEVEGLPQIAHAEIHPSPLNPRKHFDEDALAQLAASIKEKGVKQPILVRPHRKKKGEFEIVAGERRWRAAGLAELGTMPALIEDVDDAELVTLAIIENRDRQNVHPLEEAEGYATVLRLREAEGDADQVTAELAQQAGYKDRRIVQKRIKLARELSPKAKEAFLRGEMTLAIAQVLCHYPHDIQDDALEPIAEGWGSWRTAEYVNKSLREEAGLAQRYALFEPEAYTGKTMHDDEDELIYLDRAKAEKLQRAAFKALPKKLKDKGWAFVNVLSHSWATPSEHITVHEDQAKPGGKTGVNLYLDDRTLEVSYRYTKPDASRATGKGKKAEDKPSGPQPYERRHFREAAVRKTARLQDAIYAHTSNFAAAVAIIGLIPRKSWHEDHEIRGWMDGKRANGDDKFVPPFPRLAIELRKLGKDGAAPSGFSISDAEDDKDAVSITSEPAALETLVAAKNIGEIFRATVAAQCGSWPGFNPSAGDKPVVRNLAKHVAEHLPSFEMDAVYLKNFTIDQLRRVAAACIHEAAAAEMPAKKVKAVAFILEHADRDVDWTPPEMRFDTPEAVMNDLTKQLAEPKAKKKEAA